LRDIPGVAVYLDDILITAKSRDMHLRALDVTLGCLRDAGLRLKVNKCEFLMPSVAYLGHVMDAQGLHPDPNKIKALKEAPTPSNVTELRAFVGLLTFYIKFIPRHANLLAPLYALLRKDVAWKWTNKEMDAFKKAKSILTSDSVLTAFSNDLPVVVACDASSDGVAGVLSHKLPDALYYKGSSVRFAFTESS
jgi:hypothetical protein